MLRIHKSQSKKKLLALGVTSICGAGALLGLQALTYTPELGHAETVSTEDSKEKRTLANVEYMQEVSPAICANTPEADTAGNNQFQLKDSRDQKTYWVAKLKDGNCWMTQNLALDLSTSGFLTSDSSDISTEAGYWRPALDTQTTLSGWDPTENVARSYNPGSYVYTTPNSQNECARTTVGLSACISNGWRNMDGFTPSTDPNFYKNNRNQVVVGSMYDAHYLSGNYYSWTAATAGSGNASVASDGENATSSICPKGWRLPTDSASSNGAFGYVLAQYGVDTNLTQGNYDIRLSPLHFVYGGYISYGYGISNALLVSAGGLGNYWSSTVQSVTNAYNLTLGWRVYPSLNPNFRWAGIPVRCVTRTEVNNNVEITVNPTISLDVAREVEVEKGESNPATAELEVKVASNQGYSVGISAEEPALTSETSNVKIPAKSGLLNANENGWGIKLNSETNYTAVTKDLQTFYTASGAEIKTIPFTIGISASPDLPAAEYSTNITVTATQN